KEPQALALEGGRDEPTGIRLEQDAVDAELVAELRQTLDQLGRRAERDFLREDVVVREIRHALGLKAPLLGGAGARASDRRAPQLGLPGEEGHDALRPLLERRALRAGGVNTDTHGGRRRPRMPG